MEGDSSSGGGAEALQLGLSASSSSRRGVWLQKNAYDGEHTTWSDGRSATVDSSMESRSGVACERDIVCAGN